MPVLAVCGNCRAEYQLKDEHAGRKVKCKECGSVIVVPEVAEADAYAPPRDEEGPFGHDRFLINQKRVSISEKYYIYDERQNPILFVERPVHILRSLGALLAALFVAGVGVTGCIMLAVTVGKDPQTKDLGAILSTFGIFASVIVAVATAIALQPKRHIYIYTDDTKSNLLLEVFQDQKFQIIWATYTVRDPREGLLGKFQKNYLYNVIRKRWDAFRPDGSPIIVAREDSLILSLLRRFLGPMLGLLRTNFVFLRPNTDTVIGEFNRKITLFDRYVLDLSADRARELDRRMAVALGILLDTGERR